MVRRHGPRLADRSRPSRRRRRSRGSATGGIRAWWSRRTRQRTCTKCTRPRGRVVENAPRRPAVRRCPSSAPRRPGGSRGTRRSYSRTACRPIHAWASRCRGGPRSGRGLVDGACRGRYARRRPGSGRCGRRARWSSARCARLYEIAWRHECARRYGRPWRFCRDGRPRCDGRSWRQHARASRRGPTKRSGRCARSTNIAGASPSCSLVRPVHAWTGWSGRRSRARRGVVGGRRRRRPRRARAVDARSRLARWTRRCSRFPTFQ